MSHKLMSMERFFWTRIVPFDVLVWAATGATVWWVWRDAGLLP